MACLATAVAAGPFSRRQEDPAVNPATPTDWTLVYGPVDAANNAPGFMGLQYLDTYDVQACTDACTARAPDSEGGPCEFVNIWRAVNAGVVGSTTCSFYFTPTDGTTATNAGQNDLAVTFSRGYQVNPAKAP